MDRERKTQLIEYLVRNNGKGDNTWAEILQELNIEVNHKTLKQASDAWRYYKKTNVVSYKNKDVKILIFDVETAPLTAYVWARWNQTLYDSKQIIQPEWFMLTWSAKWLFDDNIMNASLTPEEVKEEDDLRIVERFWELLNEADIVIAHNADKFDIKILNGRFIKYGFKPPSPYKVIDTLKVVKRRMRLPSNRLNEVCAFLGLDTKIDTGGFDLWKGFLKGDKDSINKMLEYNDQDVIILEQLYLRIRAWVPNHPNVNLFTDNEITSCPACGSNNLSASGSYVTGVSKFDVHQCNNCGFQARGRTSTINNKPILKAL